MFEGSEAPLRTQPDSALPGTMLRVNEVSSVLGLSEAAAQTVAIVEFSAKNGPQHIYTYVILGDNSHPASVC